MALRAAAAGRGYMPQKDLLMPWKTVGDNVAVGRVAQGVARQQARSEADQVLSRFGLGDFAGLYPRVLSGGMRQRAALARTYLAGNDSSCWTSPSAALDSLTGFRCSRGCSMCGGRPSRRSSSSPTTSTRRSVWATVYVLTERPASVAVVLDVDLGRPRPYESVPLSQFARLKAIALRHLHTGSMGMGDRLLARVVAPIGLALIVLVMWQVAAEVTAPTPDLPLATRCQRRCCANPGSS